MIPAKGADIAAQPLLLHTQRLTEALDYVGAPLSTETRRQLAIARRTLDDVKSVQLVQEVLDPLCLAIIHINPESRVKVTQGPAKPELVEQGWRSFLIKVINSAGVTAPLKVTSANALPMSFGGWGGPGRKPPTGGIPNLPRDRWLGLLTFDSRPLNPNLSGLPVEYRILHAYSRDQGKRAAIMGFDVGQGTQDLGFRSELLVTFDAQPSTPLTLEVLDEFDKPTVAGFIFRDSRQRVYPSQAKRIAPDFHFHPQVYRANGEKIVLPPGEYNVEVTRGPEYLSQQHKILVGSRPVSKIFRLKRWIDPSILGWWSGDHHIHAAGCAHYTNPSEGVLAKDMIRHCLGEDLKVGANLTWGPGFDYQKQFFTGKTDAVSRHPYIIRYDVEVSGFGSHRSGHLCLLRLKKQIYPGGNSKNHWPTLCLNTLRWAQKQGAVCGPAHSGWGLKVSGDKLPTYEIPPFDGIGANEFIVDVTHNVPGPDGKLVPAVDFLSMVDTPAIWELNIWYHVLNCGFRTRISGETDFPCIYGERVGLGRAYVKVDGKLNYDKWCEGIVKGAAYVSDGRSHLIDFQVNDTRMGVGESEVQLVKPGKVQVQVKAAARLNETPNAGLMKLLPHQKPYWHVERARVSQDTRQVRVELIRNGYPVDSRMLEADGSLQDMTFEVDIQQSSWLALRIFPSSHTNPVFVEVGKQPVRASIRSAKWCIESVEKCWTQKKRHIADAEMQDAIAAYNHARMTYRKILAESKME